MQYTHNSHAMDTERMDGRVEQWMDGWMDEEIHGWMKLDKVKLAMVVQFSCDYVEAHVLQFSWEALLCPFFTLPYQSEQCISCGERPTGTQASSWTWAICKQGNSKRKPVWELLPSRPLEELLCGFPAFLTVPGSSYPGTPFWGPHSLNKCELAPNSQVLEIFNHQTVYGL